MSNSSVGAISLDLIIKDKLGEQLEKIKSSVRSPAEKIGDTISHTIENAVKNVGKTAGKAVNEAVESAEKSVSNDVENAIARLLKREEQQRQALLDTANSIPESTSESSGNYMRYNTDEIMKQVDKFEEAINKPVREAVEKTNKKLAELGKFEVKAIPHNLHPQFNTNKNTQPKC